ncbi:hypothetical protein Q7P37_002109 [Cladosporium fusiforme]
MRSSSFVLRAALAVLPLTQNSLTLAAKIDVEYDVALGNYLEERQAVATATPTAVWAPAAVCANGGPVATGGAYTDGYGAIWDVRCGNSLTKAEFEKAGTYGQGIYACAKGCDSRPECNSFVYAGTVSGATTGSGLCYYRDGDPGNFVPITGNDPDGRAWYAAAKLVSNGAPNQFCPRLNNTDVTTSYSGGKTSVYTISCGRSSSDGIWSQMQAGNMQTCLGRCDADPACTGFSFQYGNNMAAGADNAERVDAQAAFNPGVCYFRTGAGASPDQFRSRRNFAAKKVAAQNLPYTALPAPFTTTTTTSSVSTSSSSVSTSSVSTTTVSTTSSSTTSSSSATASCTGTPNPPSLTTLTCTGINENAGLIGRFTDACGVEYDVTCGKDTAPGASRNVPNIANIHACMQTCDADTQCRAATFAGGSGSGICYLKYSYTGITSTSNTPTTLAALVRYIPPNTNYAVPQTATGGGCGQALPGGLVANGASVQFTYTPTDGIQRRYLVHIPQYYDINKASPVIFGFHGQGGSAEDIQTQTGFNDPILNPYAIAIYVQGVGTPSGWESNPYYGPGKQNVQNDRNFIKELIVNIKSTFCVDATRIFGAGSSNGGGFLGVIACDPELSVTFAAIAPNAGAFYTNTNPPADPYVLDTDTPVQQPCNPGRNNMAIFETHGTGDTRIGYWGGDRYGKVWATIPRWLNNWATRQGLSTTNYTTYPRAKATLVRWGNDVQQLGRLQHLRLEDWVHEWPGSSAPIAISPYVMDFFYRWTDPNRGPLTIPATNSYTNPVTISTTITTTSSSSSSVTTSTATTTLSSTPGGPGNYVRLIHLSLQFP